MILLFYIAVNIAVLAVFTKINKKLHILEIIVYWLFSTYVFQNFSAICSMNFKTLLIPEQLSYEFTHFINRIVLYPILMVLFLNFYLACDTYAKKFLLLLGSVCFFVGLEEMAGAFGVLKHVHWRLWWSFAYWISALLILVGFMTFFRKILYKGSVDS